jgi:hypothetical protein
VTLNAGALLALIIAAVIMFCGFGLLLLIMIKRNVNEYDEYEENSHEYTIDDVLSSQEDPASSDAIGFSFENVISDQDLFGSIECEEAEIRW